jgi:hypothetical protein
MARDRLILFGAFDRHNFGDLLLAHCALAAHPARPAVLAGLLARDLRRFGGHRVHALQEVIAACGDEPAEFVHVGGEILTTTAWEAAVMLQTPDDAARAIAAHDRDEASRRAWAEQVLGRRCTLPYVIAAADLPPRWSVHFNAVGGVALAGLPPALRREAFAALRGAASVSVRDRITQATLARAGIAAALVHDPAASAATTFAAAIARHAAGAALAPVVGALPRRLTLQVAAEWGDDATLDAIAGAAVATATRLAAGIVLFRAGLAPWHDDAAVLERLAARLRTRAPQIGVAHFDSAHVFDICALLAGACGHLGTSLHAWIVADSARVPACCLVASAGAKAAAYLDTWGGSARRWASLAELGAGGSLL